MTYSLEAAAELLYRITGITELPANCDGLAACLNAAVAESTERDEALERRVGRKFSENDMDPICGMETDDEPHECPNCGGRGFVNTCWDGLCQDGCIHGDGEEMCPACQGSGEKA